MLGEFRGREGDVISGIIQQGQDPRNVLVDFGTVEGILPARRAGAGRALRPRRAAALLRRQRQAGAARARRSASSRTHPNLVRTLFKLEVPEIADGTVEIAALAREAGHRTKIAVHAKVAGVNAKGACIGPMGARVRAVMTELRGEKIDIVDYADDPADVRRGRPVAGPGAVGRDRRRRGPRRPVSSCRTTSCSSRSARRGRTPASPPS